jgi:mono/diheme cytochrome c family protein
MTGLWMLSGCDEKYPADLKYPLRDDPVIIGNIDSKPTSFDKPGQLFTMLDTMVPADKRKEWLLPASTLTGPQRQEMSGALEQYFGTPLAPKVNKIDSDAETLLKLDAKTLAEGSAHYRLHCLHCHGLTGNGRGPTAPWVNPHPRDYRRGTFKFTSSDLAAGERKARRDDLLRTIRDGLNGTTMPAHNLLSDKELTELVSYVIHLSIRGETEEMAMRALGSAGGNVEEEVEAAVDLIVARWLRTENSVIRPESAGTPDQLEASIANGYRMFVEPSENGGAACISCHEDFGRKPRYLNDVWGTIVRPANLTKNVYRGGRRPIDLYWRIHSGVNGAQMPAIFDSLKPVDSWLNLLEDGRKLSEVEKQRKDVLVREIARLSLSEKERAEVIAGWAKLPAERREALKTSIASQRNWDLVHFLVNLPYPEMRKKNHIDIHAGGEAE